MRSEGIYGQEVNKYLYRRDS